MTKWLVAASSTTTKIYNITRRKKTWDDDNKPTLIKTLSHPTSQLKNYELASDRPGNFRQKTLTQGKYMPQTDPHHKEMMKFAKEITQYLELEYSNKSFSELILCAEPHFYGLLNQHISKQLALSITKRVQKDYVTLDENKFLTVIDELR